MKKVILIVTIISGILISGCKNEAKQLETPTEIAAMEYHCPMKCEGDKTYADKDAKCPVCNMGLVAVEKTSDTHTDH